MNTNRTKFSDRRNQQGAALVVGLMLLVVITVLAISGMNTATTELALARNDQAYEDAFQTAESGLENALAQGGFNTSASATITDYGSSNNSYSTTIDYENATIVPDRAFSLGAGSGVAAYHFLATSQADIVRDVGNITDRDSSAIHSQAFYVVGPEMSAL